MKIQGPFGNRRGRRAAWLLPLVTCVLAGCGLKGDLEHPVPTAPSAVEAAPATPVKP